MLTLSTLHVYMALLDCSKIFEVLVLEYCSRLLGVGLVEDIVMQAYGVLIGMVDAGQLVTYN